MKKQITTIIILILSINAFAQNNINGIILDASTLEPMVGASVSCITDNSGVIADTNGKFSLSSTHDSVSLKISYIGYSDTLISCAANCNLGFIYLQPIEQYLSDVTIYAHQRTYSRTNQDEGRFGAPRTGGSTRRYDGGWSQSNYRPAAAYTYELSGNCLLPRQEYPAD